MSTRTRADAFVPSHRDEKIQTLAQLGFFVKGVVYIIVGVLALQVAFGEGGQTTGSQGAIQTIANQPFGQILLWVTALGLFGYGLWRLIQAIRDPDHVGNGAKGIATRIGWFASGLMHGLLAAYTIQLALGSGGGGDSKQTWTARLMEQPFGEWLIGLAGVAIIIGGLTQFNIARKEKFMKDVSSTASASARKWLRRIGKWGYAARGVVFALIGWFLIRAAIQSDSSEVIGLEGALNEVAKASFGTWLLALVAAGLAFYGLFCVVKARYREV